MFTYFYHSTIRKSVSIFGSLFNNLFIVRKNAAGATISQVKCPLSYAPKRNFIDRLKNMANGEDAERHEKGRTLKHTVEPTFHITGEQRGDGHDVQQGEPDDQ